MRLLGVGRNVVHHHGDALGVLGKTRPVECGRKARAVAGAAHVEQALRVERGAVEVHAGRVRDLWRRGRRVVVARRVVIARRRGRAIAATLTLTTTAASAAASTTATLSLSLSLPLSLSLSLARRATRAAALTTATAAFTARGVGLLRHLAVGVGEHEVRLAVGQDLVRDRALLRAADLVLERPRLLAGLLEADDARAAQHLQRRTHRIRVCLRHDFVLGAGAGELGLAAQTAVDVRERLRRVVVVRARAAAETFALGQFAEVTVELVELVVRAARARAVFAGLGRGIEQPVDRETVERVRDRLALADDLGERERCGVVVVVVGASAVAAELVELADREAVDAAVVERVEDRDAVGRERDRALHEVRLAEDRLVGELGLERDLPGVRAFVLLRERDLLLPRGDADHHRHLERLVRQAVALDVEPALVGARLHKRREGVEDRGLRGLAGCGRLRCGGLRRGRLRRGVVLRGRLFDARLVERADRGDALLGLAAIGRGQVVERDGREFAGRRRDRDLARAREEERAVDDFARARVGPRTGGGRVELVGRMRVRVRGCGGCGDDDGKTVCGERADGVEFHVWVVRWCFDCR